MSDSQQALNIAHAALVAMSENGAKLYASVDVLRALAATAPATKLAVNAQSRTTLPQAAKFAPVVSLPAKIITESPAPLPLNVQPLIHTLAPTSGTKAERLAAMRKPVMVCQFCPNLVKTRTQVVFGVGDANADLMFVGDSPSEEDDLVGEPFCGQTGMTLTKIIETMGFHRSQVYIANVLKCRTDGSPGSAEKRKPTASEMQFCKQYLLEQINIIQPRVIVALGTAAMEGLLGMTKVAIATERGNWRMLQGIPLMPTYHPAYFQETTSLTRKRQFWEDMLAVLEKLGRPISAKQEGYFLPRD